MDVGRLVRDVRFQPRYCMGDAYAAYLEWLRKTPNFFEDRQ
jgi:hypothetical protein